MQKTAMMGGMGPNGGNGGGNGMVVAGGTFPGQQPTMNMMGNPGFQNMSQQQQQQLRSQQQPFAQPPPGNAMFGNFVRFPLPFLKL